MKNKFLLLLTLALCSFFTFTACDDDDDPVAPGELTIFEVAANDNNFNTLAQAIRDAGLQAALEGTGPFTVFAPTDAAFDNLPDGLLDDLSATQLAEILRYHVISGQAIASSQLEATQDVPSLLGEVLLIDSGDGVTVNNLATVSTADIPASNGVIHAINEVLLPEAYRDNNIIDQAKDLNIFTTLVSAVEDAGLTTTLQFRGDFTVFAPTDAAFDLLPDGLLASLTPAQLSEILQYHVLNGEVASTALDPTQAPSTLTGESVFVTREGTNVTVNQASVVTADVNVTNGIIHAIDRVLLPDAFGTVVDVAAKRYDFETLVQSVIDAQLVNDLSNSMATLTVFAPTDDAFDNLPAGLLENLTADQLREVLQYHVLPAEVFAGDLQAEQMPASLTQEPVFVTRDAEGNVNVNGAPAVIQADLDANNGVVHAINQVILPDAFGTVVDAAAKRYMLSTLVGAVIDAGLDDDLSASTENGFTIFAPTNAAFGELASVPTGEALINVLQYHVLPNRVLSSQLSATQTVPTLNGDSVTVTVEDGIVRVNGSAVVGTADIVGTNGVIHIIDEVLLPPAN
ncbi:MAG: fasciclin domain-containing protein [Bacteroidota bacterium]